MLYNERDVHAAAYGFIRKFLKRNEREGLRRMVADVLVVIHNQNRGHRYFLS